MGFLFLERFYGFFVGELFGMEGGYFLEEGLSVGGDWVEGCEEFCFLFVIAIYEVLLILLFFIVL